MRERFKPFDKIIYRNGKNDVWHVGEYVKYTGCRLVLTNGIEIKRCYNEDDEDFHIQPYTDDKEYLIGTQDPFLKEGTPIMYCRYPNIYCLEYWRIGWYNKETMKNIELGADEITIVPFDRFNPRNLDDMHKYNIIL